MLYILDEPSIGLHQRDNRKLIDSLCALRDAGNSVIVVEHDEDMMLASDALVDIGPGAGVHGGQIVAQGPPQSHLDLGSITAQYLTGAKSIPVPSKRRKATFTSETKKPHPERCHWAQPQAGQCQNPVGLSRGVKAA